MARNRDRIPRNYLYLSFLIEGKERVLKGKKTGEERKRGRKKNGRDVLR